MGALLYSSDVHAGHEFVAGLRGFTSAAEHDREIIRRWNRKVRPEDTVWVLGDVALGKRAETLKLYGQLNGTMHLVWGNHDKCHPYHKSSWTYHKMYLEYFQTIQPFAEHRIAGERVMLSHFPYEKDRGDPREMQYRLRDEGRFLLHGHLHSRERITSAREIHVGLDAWELEPVTQHVISTIIMQQLEKEVTENAAPEAAPV